MGKISIGCMFINWLLRQFDELVHAPIGTNSCFHAASADRRQGQ